MKSESFKITYTTTQRVRAIKVDSPGLVSFSMFSENLTSAAKVNLYTSNFADIDRAVPYTQLSSITTNNEGHHENLRDVNSTYLIVEVDYQSSTAGEVSFNLNFIPEQSFFLTSKPRVRISQLNSTYTALDASEVFTGEWEDILDYPSINFRVKSDQNCDIQIQFSPDRTNIDSTLTRYYRTNQIEPPHKFARTAQYYRLVITNSTASNQTYLRVPVIIGETDDLNIPVDAVASQDYDAKIVRPTKFEYEVALGRRQGNTTWNKFGYNTDVDSAATEVIAAFGGTFTPLTSASTLTIVSSSASDDGAPAGIGANTLVIYGVDANRVAQTETITMNGTTNVVTSGTWLGVNRVAIGLSGSSLTNVGLITITATTGGSTQATIPIGEGITQQAIFFTQKDHNFLTDFLRLNVEKTGGGSSPKCRVKGWVFNAVTNTKFNVFNELIDSASDNFTSLNPSQPFTIPEKSVLWFEATTDTNDTFVSCRFSGIEFKDVDA